VDAPYGKGDEVVFLSLDPEGMRPHRSQVLSISETEPGRWQVETGHGEGEVNQYGVGASIVPMDEEMATELARKGDGHLVRSTTRDALDQWLGKQGFDQSLNQSLDQRLDQSLDQNRKKKRGRGL
jgi:hypothetical protein